MNRKFYITLCLCAFATLYLYGCGKSIQIDQVDPVCISADKAQLMQASQTVLGKMNFQIAKLDTDAGLIITKPLESAKFFEFWRTDNIGKYNKQNANLHSIRKIVRLTTTKSAGSLCLNCDVQIQRLSLPKSDIDTSQVYRVHSQGRYETPDLNITDEQKKNMTWINLGQDNVLATEILEQIKIQAIK